MERKSLGGGKVSPFREHRLNSERRSVSVMRDGSSATWGSPHTHPNLSPSLGSTGSLPGVGWMPACAQGLVETDGEEIWIRARMISGHTAGLEPIVTEGGSHQEHSCWASSGQSPGHDTEMRSMSIPAAASPSLALEPGEEPSRNGSQVTKVLSPESLG